MAEIPPGGLMLSDEGRIATLELRDLPVIDQPQWPAHDAHAEPARMTVKCSWTATPDPVRVRDAMKQFSFDGTGASCQLEAEVHVPATGFRWRSDPMATSRAAFGVIGREENGRYFTAT